MVVQVAVSRCYWRMRPLAIGVAVAGNPASQVVGPPLLALLLGHYNLRITLFVTGVAMLCLCLATTRLPSGPPCSISERPAGYVAVLQRRGSLVLFLVMALTYASLFVSWATIPLALFATGHSPRDVSLHLSLAGLANLAARAVTGLLHYRSCRPFTTFRLASAMATIATSGK